MEDVCVQLDSCLSSAQRRLFEEGEDSGNYADDATWVLTSSFVILTMQSGFGLLEMGHSMPGHEINIMLKNVFDVVFGALAFYFLGYGISYGQPSIPFMGLGDFLPGSDGSTADSIDTGLLHSRYLFQFSFAATSTTIVSGMVAMRMRFFTYCAFSFYAVIVYAFVAHWVWADDGWLKTLGVHDFAGSGPVHVLGGVNGLVGILMVGNRMGRFDGSRPASDFAAFSPTSTLFGLFILWWGWIGFNCGSSFGITNDKWLVATRAGVNTINSTAGGGLAALVYSQLRTPGGKSVYPEHVVNGILGSLVSITASCASVRSYESLIIGFCGSVLANAVNEFLVEQWWQLDDPVGAMGVHVAAGFWGLISVGLFASSDLPGLDLESSGLFHGGGFALLGYQVLACLVISAWAVACTAPFFYFMGVLGNGGDWRHPRSGLRVDDATELLGMDAVLHGGVDSASKQFVDEMSRAQGLSDVPCTRFGPAAPLAKDPEAAPADEGSDLRAQLRRSKRASLMALGGRSQRFYTPQSMEQHRQFAHHALIAFGGSQKSLRNSLVAERDGSTSSIPESRLGVSMPVSPASQRSIVLHQPHPPRAEENVSHAPGGGSESSIVDFEYSETHRGLVGHGGSYPDKKKSLRNLQQRHDRGQTSSEELPPDLVPPLSAPHDQQEKPTPTLFSSAWTKARGDDDTSSDATDEYDCQSSPNPASSLAAMEEGHGPQHLTSVSEERSPQPGSDDSVEVTLAESHHHHLTSPQPLPRRSILMMNPKKKLAEEAKEQKKKHKNQTQQHAAGLL